MKEVVAIRHVAFEHLGTLAPLMTGRGLRVRYLDAGTANLSALDPCAAELLVVLGGPIGAYEEDQYPFLSEELKLIEARLKAEKPLLGICLGAQLMARALGSRVYPGPHKEIGWAPIHLTADGEGSCLRHLGESDFQVLHWHGDTFDLPSGATRLAASAITENQAFALGDKALGLQFHLEADPMEIERWLIGHAHEIGAAEAVTPGAIRADTAEYGPKVAPGAARCMMEWLQNANILPRPKTDSADA